MLCAAACGFFLVLVLQGKGWPYHGYPMLVFAYIILAVALSSRDPSGPRPRMEKAVLARNGGGRLRDFFLVEPRQLALRC